MRIREICFYNIRGFRGKHCFSFVDPSTGAPRPVTIIAGANGTGKTTILDSIEAMLKFAWQESFTHPMMSEAEQGLMHMAIEVTPADAPLFSLGNNGKTTIKKPEIINIAFGRQDIAAAKLDPSWPHCMFFLIPPDRKKRPSLIVTNLAKSINQQTLDMVEEGAIPLLGGMIYFPHGRQPLKTRGGTIEPIPEKPEWVYRFSSSDQWQGSLEQLWVWQNYLDLERGDAGHSNLKPFVTSVENVLGKGRCISVSGGRVRVDAPWTDEQGKAAKLRVEQLPSGEQQCLLLFGELARRRRPGAILAIDEPEASLHPALQRLVVNRLRTFAQEWDTQLILSTHSLEILRAVQPSERMILDQIDQPAAQPAPVPEVALS